MTFDELTHYFNNRTFEWATDIDRTLSWMVDNEKISSYSYDVMPSVVLFKVTLLSDKTAKFRVFVQKTK